MSLSAHAATTWVSTETHALPVVSDTGETPAALEAAVPGQSLHVAVSLKLRDRAGLDARIARIRQGSRHDVLTPAQLLARHMPTAEQAQAVAAHLSQAGFTHIEIAPNRLLITADGDAAAAKAAFNTTVRNFSVDGRSVYANVDDAQVPAELGDAVLAVTGLQTAVTFHTHSHVAPLAATGHVPTDFSTIYGADSLPAASDATVGIISNGNMAQTLKDFAAYETQVGFAPTPVTVTVVGRQGTDTSGTVEWDLDSQDIISAAGGALKQLIFYTAPTLADAPLEAAYNKAVTDNLASVINISLGECERAAKASGDEAATDQIFAAGVAQGQTWSVSTGDSGSAECKGKTGQSSPAVSPYVIAVGGTLLVTNGTTYVSESAWTGTGGGASVTEKAPDWQKQSGVLGAKSKKRGVPDISFTASPNSGAIITVNGRKQQVGGTSLSAPLFAGFWARIQSANGNQLISPNPATYQFGGANPTLFHDVTTGSNGANSAKDGWDFTTGWGSLDVGAYAAFVASHAGF